MKCRITIHLENKHSSPPPGILDGSLSLECKSQLISIVYKLWSLFKSNISQVSEIVVSCLSQVQHSFHIDSLWSLERLNYETWEHNNSSQEAQLSKIGPNIPLKKPSFPHTRLKVLLKLWSFGKGCLFKMRIDKSIPNIIEIWGLSRP